MFAFVLFKDRKRALAMTIVLGVLLAALAGVLVPAAIAAPPRCKPVEARVREIHEGAGPADPAWVEYIYEYGPLTYFVRFEEPVDSLRLDHEITLYANSKHPEMVMKEKPPESNIVTLILIVGSSVGVLFASTLVNCIFVFRKEKQHADA